jgi:anti-sigma B factor antagonist
MEKCFLSSRSRQFEPTFAALPAPRATRTDLDLSVETAGTASIVRVQTSKLTYPVLSAFFEAVRDLVEDGARHLVLDLAAVSYIDSATIGCLVEIHRLVADQGGAVKLVSLQRRVHTMLAMTGVDRFLEVYAGEAEALASRGWMGARTHHA